MSYFTTGAALTAALNALPASLKGTYKAFDAFYYAENYMDAYTGSLTPIEHFVQYGASRGYQPNADFNPAYYQSQYSDLAGFDSAELLYHYVRYGLNEGRPGNAALAANDWDAYLTAYPAVAAYVSDNLASFGGSMTNGAIAHYVKFGQTQGFTLPNVAGQTFMLTEGQDEIIIETENTIDTVKGLIEFEATSWSTGFDGFQVGGVDNSTFSNGDLIEGNGNTKVELSLDVTPSLFGEDLWFGGDNYVEAEYVEMTGVDQLALKAMDDGGVVYFDASSYGDDISKISLSGRDGMYVDIYDLQADTTLNVSLQTGGELDVSGEWSGVDFSVSLTNSDDSSNSSLNLTAAAVSLVAGNDAYAYGWLGQTATGDAAVESVAAMVLGDVNLSAGVDGEVDFSVEAHAYNTGSGTAVVGNVTIGDMSLSLAQSATDTDLTVSMTADADGGAATVGNLVVGDVTVNAADSAAFSAINFWQWAYADSANATVGSRTVGDINITLGSNASGDDNELSFSQYADADVKGNATVGGTVIGDITVNAGDDVDYQDVYVYAWADADKGNATVGDTVIGDVVMNYGDGDDSHDFSVSASADVNTAGVATVGDVTIGNITQTAGDDQDLWAYVWRRADSEKGNASVGDILVGDVVQTVGDDADASFEASQSAYADTGDATVGNLTIGDITSAGGDRADMNAWIYQWGGVDGGDLTMGDLTVGNVDMRAQVSGTAYFSVEQTGYASSTDDTITIGKTTVGNVDLYAGANGEAGFGLYVTAYNNANSDKANTSVGDVTVGHVTITAENDANADFWNTIEAGTVANVTYGDITVNAGEGAYVSYFTINVSASTGDVGDFTVGDVDINLAADATMTGTWYTAGFGVYADENIGDVTIGKQTIAVATSADFGDNYAYEHDFYANNGGIGDVEMGDIVFSGNGDNADIDLDNYFWADDNIKSVTMGVVSASADGEDSDVSIETSISASGEIGEISVGDLTAHAVGEDADADVMFDVWADDDIADVTFGNVVVHAENGQAPDVYWGDASATVSISITGSEDLANVTVGNVAATAIGQDAWSEFNLYIGYSGYLDDVGDIKIGDLTLMASGESADVNVSVSVNSDTGVIGLVELGNIDITVANTEDAYSSASVSVDVYADGDLKVGDITLVQGDMAGWGPNSTDGYWYNIYDSDGDDIGDAYDVTEEWSAADMYANVSLSSGYGDLVIGDITVSGGYKVATPQDENQSVDYNDNFDSLESWMDLYADGTITVGDINYSGYERAAYLDVEGYLGAKNITAAQDDTYIVDNKGQNTINLGAGNDTVQLVNENTGKATAAAVDVIVNFNGAKDTINLEFDWSDFAVNATDAGTYANFLVDAETADKDIYAGKVGNDYYVAFDKDGGNAVDFVIKLAGVSSVSEIFFE